MESVVNALHTDAKSLYRIYHEHAGEKLYYDAHPNVLANRVIADAILVRLQEACKVPPMLRALLVQGDPRPRQAGCHHGYGSPGWPTCWIDR
jgi:hypothetical protein